MPAEHSFPEDKSPRAIIIAVAVVAAVLIGGVFYVLMRKSMRDSPPLTLDNAIRAGSPDFEKYKKLIPLDEQEADESPRALGDIVMTLPATPRNFPDRSITGLKVHAPIGDHQHQPD